MSRLEMSARDRHHLHHNKKRPALADITNQKHGAPPPPGPSVPPLQKPMVPCATKQASNKLLVDSPDGIFSKSTLQKHMGQNLIAMDSFLLKADQATARMMPFSSSAIMDAVFPGSIITVPEPAKLCGSPSKSVGAVSLDKTKSMFDLISPDFIDSEGASSASSIKRKATSSLPSLEHTVLPGDAFSRKIFLENQTIDEVVIAGNPLDPEFHASHTGEIIKNLRASEVKKSPSSFFMHEVQKDINASMRAILIDWLVEVIEDFSLGDETLFLAVNYIDRYLSGNEMKREQLQLLGVACMMIAAKYEEVCAPQVEELCYITDNTYTKQEVLRLESAILRYLKFEMSAPTAMCFLRLFIQAAGGNKKVLYDQLGCLANYLTELSLLDYNMLCYFPSVIAAASIFLAKFMISPSRTPWNYSLKNCTLYQPSDLRDCVKALHRLCRKGVGLNLSAVRQKYSQDKFKSVTKQCCPSSIPSKYFKDLVC